MLTLKRTLGFLLVLTMLMGMIPPVSVRAEETEAMEEAIAVETTEIETTEAETSATEVTVTEETSVSESTEAIEEETFALEKKKQIILLLRVPVAMN